MVGADAYAQAALDEHEALAGNTPVLAAQGWNVQVLRERWESSEVSIEPNVASDDPTVKSYALVRRAIGALYQGKLEAAHTDLEQAIRAYSEPERATAVARNYRAHVLLQTGQAARALADAELARRADPGHNGEWRGLYYSALAQARLGQRAAAEQTAALRQGKAQLLPSDNETRRHHHLLGELVLARNESAVAIEELTAADSLLLPRGFVLVFSPPEHLPIWFSLASAHLAAGNEAAADEWFQRIADSGSEHLFWPIIYVRSFYFLGTIHENRGDAAKAREYYQRFVDFWGEGDMDRERVEEALSKL